MTKLYQTARWRKARKVFIEGKTCEWNPSHEGPLVLDHLQYTNSDGSPMTDDQLLEFEKLQDEGLLLVLCRKCAYARRNNLVLCSECGENYHKKSYSMCFKCMMKADPENYVLCKECGENYHHKKYDMCSVCFKKKKRLKSAKRGWETRRNQGRRK